MGMILVVVGKKKCWELSFLFSTISAQHHQRRVYWFALEMEPGREIGDWRSRSLSFISFSFHTFISFFLTPALCSHLRSNWGKRSRVVREFFAVYFFLFSSFYISWFRSLFSWGWEWVEIETEHWTLPVFSREAGVKWKRNSDSPYEDYNGLQSAFRWAQDHTVDKTPDRIKILNFSQTKIKKKVREHIWLDETGHRCQSKCWETAKLSCPESARELCRGWSEIRSSLIRDKSVREFR